jgi:hypothetical protein
MGGSMPGAVGFTYARTGGIPSNGPYAKKTKASAQNGMEMKFYQEGLDWKPRNISKQGSKIKKDDNGYWNPENWGEPVEIGSNEITMQGVYEPLLGISDTGDTQMMYPGEDYTFDGESVTEYPIAQDGKTLPTVKVKKEPIYVDNPRDPRLRAYQDSLNLYNKTKDIQNPKYYTDGDPSWYNWKGNRKDAEKFMRKNNIDLDYEYYRTNKFPGKIQPIKTGDFGEGMKYPIYKKPTQPVEYKKSEPKKPESKPQRETKKDLVVSISKMETPTALNKTVPNLPYRVDYSGNSQYFASDKEGEEFIKNLNKDFMENKISSPGNVSGYYETKKKKNGGWLEKYK